MSLFIVFLTGPFTSGKPLQILKSSFSEDQEKNLKSLSSHRHPKAKHLGSQIGPDDIQLIFEKKSASC